ncbi:protein FAM3A isoform X1 [Eucyclogobius newberryi]|uniref:protein FAM3A isoform X1 n=1 Tax=Eucyclogobius newberryi TaxID=166745 RepID=UPI003B59F64E
MRLTGPLRMVVLLLLVGLCWLLGNTFFGGENSYILGLFGGASEQPTSVEARPRRYKCGLSAPCPAKHLAFRIVSGAANVIGPKICLEDKMLISSVKDNVGRGLNIALANGVTGELLGTKTFDMWAGGNVSTSTIYWTTYGNMNYLKLQSCSVSDVSDLLKYLRPLHEGTLVFVTSFDDAATKLNDEARKLFEELGSTAVKELAFRDSWVFVGAKGIENKSPFEQRMKNSKTSNKYEGWPESLEMDGCIPIRPPLVT